MAPEKCSILRKEVNYLGHVVSEDGVSTDPSKIVKIKEGPVPTNADELRYFVAFAGYYRKFVKNFSTLVRTLNEKLPPTYHKKGLKRPPKTEWNWTDKDQEVFQKVKEVLSTPPFWLIQIFLVLSARKEERGCRRHEPLPIHRG